MKLSLKGADSQNAMVQLLLETEDGKDAALHLSIADVSAVVSMLYAAQGEALKQEPDRTPEVMIPIVSFQMGRSGNLRIFRAYMTENIYQDYYAENGSEIASAMELFSAFVAKEFGMTPVPFGSSSN